MCVENECSQEEKHNNSTDRGVQVNMSEEVAALCLSRSCTGQQSQTQRLWRSTRRNSVTASEKQATEDAQLLLRKSY